MPVPSTIEDFLEVSNRSGVLDKQGANDYLDRLRSTAGLPDTPARLAQLMVRDGLLTTFQAKQFLKGKWRNFVITGKYVLLEQLGVGGMGTVFLCEHRTMRRHVALKVLPPGRAGDAVGLERFYREARAVATLNHPNIVKAYDIDRDGQLHFLVMEYVDGSSLQQMVDRVGPVAIDRACHYISQSAEALQHAHETAGLVHRDIKPANILVDRTGMVKVLDMGLARFFRDEDDDLTRKNDNQSVLGTADFIAPEQAVDSHNADIRADIYGLGVTFYFLLSGRTPFPDGTMAQKLLWHQVREPDPITDFRPEVPEELAAVIRTMMAKDPADRYQTPGEVVEALLPWSATPIEPPPAAEMPQRCPALQRFDRASPSSSDGSPRSGSGSQWKTGSTPPSSGKGPAKVGGPSTPLPGQPASSVHNKVSARCDGTPLPSTVPAVKAARRAIAPKPAPSAPPANSKRVRSVPNVVLPEQAPQSGPGSSASGQRSRVGTRARRAQAKHRGQRTVLALAGGLLVLVAGGVAAWFLLGQGAPPVKEGILMPNPGYDILGLAVDPRAWPRGDHAATVSAGNFVGIWDLPHSHEAFRLTAPDFQKPARCVDFTPDGGRVLAGCTDGMLRLFEVASRNQVWAVDSGQKSVFAVAVTPDNKHALSAGEDTTVRLWDLAKGQQLGKWDGHTGAVRALALSYDGTTALTGGADGRLLWWDVPSGQVRNSFASKCHGWANCIAFCPDNKTAWVADEGGRVRRWDLASGAILKETMQHPRAVRAIRVVRGGRTVLTGCDDGHLRAFSGSSGWLVLDAGCHTSVNGLGVSGDAKELFSAGGPSVRQWTIER
jgi:serine/threonine protein kinase